MKKPFLKLLSLRTTLPVMSMLLASSSGYAIDKSKGDSIYTDASSFEKDRQAILSFVGDYKVSFDFEETVVLDENYVKHEPHHSEVRELITLVKDEGDLIVLQHILVLDDEKVIKHWRQDWHYQPDSILDCKGENVWQRENIENGDSSGLWAQVVYQVDDSPRYTAIGHWTHNDEVSFWDSAVSQRPLPRREYSTRNDYDQMFSTHRLTLLKGGWVHEQDITKAISSEKGSHLLVREKGINRYERSEENLQVGYDYWSATQGFWKDVRESWETVISHSDKIKLRNASEDTPLWKQMFQLAQEVRTLKEPYNSSEYKSKILNVFHHFIEEGHTAL